MHRARCGLLFNAIALSLGAAAAPNFFPCRFREELLQQNDDEDDVFYESDSEGKDHVSEHADEDYQDEAANSELKSELETAALLQRFIETRKNRRSTN